VRFLAERQVLLAVPENIEGIRIRIPAGSRFAAPGDTAHDAILNENGLGWWPG
jgi:hypothetical protein